MIKSKPLHRVLSLLLCTILTLTLLPVASAAAGDTGTTDTDWYYSDTSAAVFTISTADELAGLAFLVNNFTVNSFEGKTVTLANNISLTAYGDWTPIGKNDSFMFKGTFDGDGHTISNLTVNSADDYVGVGLFGHTGSSAVIQNLTVDDSVTGTGEGPYVGGIVGYNRAKIQNCAFTGDISSADGCAGGVVGNNDQGTVQNCRNTGTVSGLIAGGIIGYNFKSNVLNCYNTGSITGSNLVGGVVGDSNNPNTIIQNCYSTGSVYSDNISGGVIAHIWRDTVNLVYWNTDVFSGDGVGYNENGNASNVVGMDTTEMQDATFVTTLNNNLTALGNSELLAWKADTASVNGGYPVLAAPVTNAKAPTIDAQPQDVSVSLGETATLTVTASASGTLSYQWYENTTKTSSGGTPIGSAESASYNAPTTTTGSKYYYCEITNTDTTATDNQTATATSRVAAVKVRPEGVGENDNFETGGSIYEDFEVAVSNAATGGKVTMLQDVVLSYYPNIRKTVTLDFGGHTLTCVGLGIFSGDVTLQNGTVYNSSDTAIYVGGGTVSILNGSYIGVNIAVYCSGGTLSILGGDYTGGDYAVYCASGAVTITSGHFKISESGESCLRLYSGTMELTPGSTADVNPWKNNQNVSEVTIATSAPTNAAQPIISAQPTDMSLYIGDDATLSVTAYAATGVLSYQWYEAASKTNSGGTLITGAESASYNAPTIAAGTKHYYCVVTNTDSAATGSKTATATSNAVSVQVTTATNPVDITGMTVAEIQTAIARAVASHDTVSVIGTNAAATTTLTLNIPVGKTVNWQANYSGTLDGYIYLINLAGGGTFAVAGGDIAATFAEIGVCINSGENVAVTMSGGTVTAYGAENSGGISSDNTAVNITGGEVTVTRGEYGGVAVSSGAGVNVSGTAKVTANGGGFAITSSGDVTVGGIAEVSAPGGWAIYTTGTHSTVTVSGGTVSGTTQITIYNHGDGDVTIGGTGKVLATDGGIAVDTKGEVIIQDTAEVSAAMGYAVTTPGNVTVSGGTVEGGGGAIDSGGMVSVSGGTVQAVRSSVIAAGAVSVSDGTVKSTGSWGTTIESGGDVTVCGTGKVQATGDDGRTILTDYNVTVLDNAEVSATTGYAILGDNIVISGAAKVSVTSGFGVSTGGDITISGTASVTAGDGGSGILTNNGDITITDGVTISATTGVGVGNSGGGAINIGGNAKISATGGEAVGGGYITIGGSAEVRATTGSAIGSGYPIVIQDNAKVTATTGYAVIAINYNPVTVSGNSLVFGHAAAITNTELYDGFNEQSVVMFFPCNLSGYTPPSGDGIEIAWTGASGATYYIGDSTALLWLPSSGATAVWALSGGDAGIRYANGGNTGFIPIAGVTVTKAGQTLTASNITKTYGGGDVNLSSHAASSARAGEGGAISYAVTTAGAGASITGTTLSYNAAGTATITATAAGDGSYNSATTTFTLKVSKAGQLAPSAPTLDAKTAASITLNAIADAEYSIDGVNWQDSVTFNGLTPNTGYTFYARLKENANYNASPLSAVSAAITTDKAALDGIVTISGTEKFGETLTAVTTDLISTPIVALGMLTYQWKRGGVDITGANSVTYTLTETDIGETLTVTITAANCNGGVTSGSTNAIVKADQATPALDYTVTGDFPNKTVKITAVPGAEYSFDGITFDTVNTKTSAAAENITLYIRTAETATHNASATANVTINTANQNQAAPSAFTLQYTANGETDYTVTIPAVSGAEYSFDGMNWSGTNTETGCLPGETVTGYIRMAAKQGYNAGSAVSASVNLPLFTVKTPAASPAGGSYTNAQSVTLSCATTGAAIYYTTNGTTPTISSTPYTSAISVSATTTIKAIAAISGMTDSAVLTVTYTISSSSGGGGGGGGSTANASITPTKADFDKNGGKDIAITLSKGSYTLNSLTNGSYTLKSGTDYTVSGNTYTIKAAYLNTLAVGEQTITFNMSGGTNPKLIVAVKDTTKAWANPFTDVKDGAWYYDAVKYVYEKGLIIGTAADKFSPDSTLTRGMIVTILYRHAGEPDVSGLSNPFDDVATDIWYTNAVKWAANNGIVSGYGNGKYGPNDPVTKEQLAVIIYRTQQATGKTPKNVVGASIPNAGKISSWAKDAVNALNNQGIFKDIPGDNFNPQIPASRAEVASMLFRYLTAIE